MKNALKNSTFRMYAVLALALGGLVMYSACNATDTAATQKTIADTNTKLADMKAQNDKATADAQAALDIANAMSNKVAAAQAQKQLDDAAKNAKTLKTAQTVNDAAGAGLAASTGDTTQAEKMITTLGGTLPPPFGLVVELGSAIGFGIWRDRKAAQAKTDATAALDAQATIANHALTPGATAPDVLAHQSTVLSGMTQGAKDLYNAAPDVAVPSMPGVTV